MHKDNTRVHVKTISFMKEKVSTFLVARGRASIFLVTRVRVSTIPAIGGSLELGLN